MATRQHHLILLLSYCGCQQAIQLSLGSLHLLIASFYALFHLEEELSLIENSVKLLTL
jgi:hypothetical protein